MDAHQTKRASGNGAKPIGRIRAALPVLLCIIALAFSCFLVGCANSSDEQAASGADSTGSTATFASTPSEQSIDESSEAEEESTHSIVIRRIRLYNPIDFAELKRQNPDVYAWLYVPDTGIDQPVLQHPTEESYYLEHDMHHNEPSLGAIFSQFMNARDFSDPVTLLYAHTYEEWTDLKDAMFGPLHLLEDKAFFDSHPFFYIYTPDRMLVYRIVSVYEFDDRHILNTIDLSTRRNLQRYFNYVLNPDAKVKNVRKNAYLDARKDKIVQLSTCTRPANDAARYIVTGALIVSVPFADQRT